MKQWESDIKTFSISLKPCLWCGGPGKILSFSIFFPIPFGPRQFKVVCLICSAQRATWMNTVEEAVKVWNDRLRQ